MHLNCDILYLELGTSAIIIENKKNMVFQDVLILWSQLLIINIQQVGNK